MEKDLVFASEADFKSYCDEHSDLVHLIYKNIVYDITEFVDDHPGGAAFIYDFQNKDITEAFHSEEFHEHSNVALRMLFRYRAGRLQYLEDNNTSAVGEKTQEPETYPMVTEEKAQYRDFTIDLKKAMGPQILKLNKEQYLHMIRNPIHLPYCRIFDNNVFEKLSRNPWYRIPIIWTPICIILLYFGLTVDYREHFFVDKYLYNGSQDFSLLGVMLVILLGVILWTFTEYFVHKLLHIDLCLPDNKYALYLHFMLHGLHHTVPMDRDRFVFPPLFGALVYGIVFPALTAVFSGNFGRILAAGILLGYVGNDVFHIYIHNNYSSTIGWVKRMRKDHYQHHYASGEKESEILMNI